MHLKVRQMSITHRRYLPDLVTIEAEVPGLDKTTKMELKFPTGKGLQYINDYFNKGEIGSYNLSVRPFKSREVTK